jgi:hypothetical protein
VHLFRPSKSFLAEAQPRLENRRGQKALFAREKNYKLILYIHIFFKFINLLMNINNFVYSMYLLSACQQN